MHLYNSIDLFKYYHCIFLYIGLYNFFHVGFHLRIVLKADTLHCSNKVNLPHSISILFY